MKIRAGYNPFLIAGDIYAGVAVLAVYRGNRYVAATDGRAMVLVPVDSDPTETFPSGAVIPADKALVGRSPTAFAVEGDRIRHASGATFPLPDIRFPDVLAILADADRQADAGDCCAAFGINAVLLASLQKAMAADALDVRVYGADRPIVVRPIIYGEPDRREGGPIGCIMPVSSDSAKNSSRKGRKGGAS